MNTVTKYYADPNISRRIITPNFVGSTLPNKFPMPDKNVSGNSGERVNITVSGKPGVTVKGSQPAANPYGEGSSNIDALKSGLAPTNPYGDSSNIGALKSGLATGDSCGLDEALSSQNSCCHDSCDSFILSPQAMLFNAMQDLLMPPSTSAYGQAMNMMNGGMMPSVPSASEQMASIMSGGFNSPCFNPGFGFGFNSPMQMMNPGFGLNSPMNASWNFSSFSGFWGGGQF